MCNENILITPPVPLDKSGVRLDKWLSEVTDLSRSRLSNLIDQGLVLFENAPVLAQDRKVKTDDIFEIRVPKPIPAIPEAQEIDLEIVYEDDDLLVINKTAGMVVHPAAGNQEGTLVNALLAHCKDSLSGIGGVIRPGIVHRLDKDTSGLLVVAKNDFTHQKLSEQFAVHSVERCYKALVWGLPNPMSGVIETKIGRSRTDRKKMAVLRMGGKQAITHYEVLEVYLDGALSLLECCLKTGRTHQVRVHLTSIGHPLVGDPVYGKKSKIAKDLDPALQHFNRQALHSYKMAFEHPKTGKIMKFKSNLPEDMQTLIDSF